MRRTRTVAVLGLASASLVLTAGCGGGSSPTITTLVSPGVPAAGTASSATGSSPASATTSPGSSSQNPDATTGFRFRTGDRVETTYSIEAPTSFAAANQIVQECPLRMNFDPSRAVVYHIVLSAKLTSSMGGTFTMHFGTPVPAPLAVRLSGGDQCWAAGINDDVTFTMTPGQSNRLEMWFVADGALSPAHPAGDPAVLQQLVLQPSLFPGDNTFGLHAGIDYVFGSRVLACDLSSVYNIQAEIFADPAAFARGEEGCKAAVDKAAFAALEAKAGTVTAMP